MKIGFYSPSTPITKLAPLRFQRAKRFLTAKGVSLVAGSLTGKGDFYRSGSIAQRAAELNQLIHNDELDVIMATIGGTNSNSLLPYIDYEYLEEHPKTSWGGILTPLRSYWRLRLRHQVVACYMVRHWSLHLANGRRMLNRLGTTLFRL